LEVSLNQDDIYAGNFLAGIAPALSADDMTLNLRQI